MGKMRVKHTGVVHSVLCIGMVDIVDSTFLTLERSLENEQKKKLMSAVK